MDLGERHGRSFIELHFIIKKYSHKFDGSHIVYTNVVLVETSALAAAIAYPFLFTLYMNS